jgi:hypothetical protein
MTQAELRIENSNRAALIKKGRYLESFTIGYNSLEGLIAVAAGLIAGALRSQVRVFQTLLPSVPAILDSNQRYSLG